jgi:hypothetical protein
VGHVGRCTPPVGWVYSQVQRDSREDYGSFLRRKSRRGLLLEGALSESPREEGIRDRMTEF